MVSYPEHKLELVVIFLFVCFSFPKFMTPVCIEFCMCLKLGKILFSRGIDFFSLPRPSAKCVRICVCVSAGEGPGLVCKSVVVETFGVAVYVVSGVGHVWRLG
jgi:hypothetical protein